MSLAAPASDTVPYVIQPGDTLRSVAQRLLLPPPNLAAVQQINSLANLDHIREGQVLLLPRQALRFTPSPATVLQLRCNTDILLNHTPLEVGHVVHEGDVLDIPATCSLGLALEDGSVVRVPAGGRLQINMLRNNRLERAPVIRMQISRGRVEVSVSKGAPRTAPFEISTPTAVMGVRGTEFRVGHSDDDRSLVEVLSGAVGVQGTDDQAATDESRVPAGRGVVRDAAGTTVADEALLSMPTLSVIDTTPMHWRLRVEVPNAPDASVWTRTSQLATLADSPAPRLLSDPEFWIHTPDNTAMFYELTGQAASGLQGMPARVGVCLSPDNTCNVVFSSPLPPSMPIRFTLKRLDIASAQTLVLVRNLRSADGLFVITGLAAGRYAWQITQAQRSGQASLSPNRLQQGGEFSLLAPPEPSPP